MSRLLSRERRVSWRRLVAAGAVAAAIVLALGIVSEVLRFGATDQAAAARIAVRVQGDFADITRGLSEVAAQVAASTAASRGLARGDDGQRELFDLLLADLTDTQIAAALGKRAGAIRTAHWRLLIKLRGCLGMLSRLGGVGHASV